MDGVPAETGCSPCSGFAAVSLASLVNPLNVHARPVPGPEGPPGQGCASPAVQGAALCPELGGELPVWWVLGRWQVTGP